MSLVNDALKRAAESDANKRPAATINMAELHHGTVTSRRHRPNVVAVFVVGAIAALVVLCVAALTTDLIGPSRTAAATPVESQAMVQPKPVKLFDIKPDVRTPAPAPTATRPASAPAVTPDELIANLDTDTPANEAPAPAATVQPRPVAPAQPTTLAQRAVAPMPTETPTRTARTGSAPIEIGAPRVADAGDPGLSKSPLPAAASGNGYHNYTVANGDTLSSIAAKFYGKRSDWHKLYAANQDRLPDPNRLSVGLTLRVPNHPER